MQGSVTFCKGAIVLWYLWFCCFGYELTLLSLAHQSSGVCILNLSLYFSQLKNNSNTQICFHPFPPTLVCPSPFSVCYSSSWNVDCKILGCRDLFFFSCSVQCCLLWLCDINQHLPRMLQMKCFLTWRMMRERMRGGWGRPLFGLCGSPTISSLVALSTNCSNIFYLMCKSLPGLFILLLHHCSVWSFKQCYFFFKKQTLRLEMHVFRPCLKSDLFLLEDCSAWASSVPIYICVELITIQNPQQ